MSIKFPVSLFLVFSLGYSSLINAQLLISKFVDEICYGPENVVGDHEVVSLAYIEHIDQTKHKLQNLKLEKDSILIGLNTKPRLNKKDKRKRSRVEATRQSIDNEITYLIELKRKWTVYFQRQNMLKQAYEHLESGKCLSFTTDRGKVSSHQVELLKLDEGQSSPVKEFIKVSITEAGTRWEQRKAEKNCLSANPDDCLVWCLVELPGGYVFTDMSEKKWIQEACPDNMTYKAIQFACSKNFEITYNMPIARYEIIGKKNEVTYQFIDWEYIDCE